MLLERANHEEIDNWLEEWWESLAYLSVREGLTPIECAILRPNCFG